METSHPEPAVGPPRASPLAEEASFSLLPTPPSPLPSLLHVVYSN